MALNSPGSKVPSHGVRAYGQDYAVDLLHPAAPGASTTIGWSLRTRRPEEYSCFGEPALAMADGTVVRATDRQRDHPGRDTWPTLLFMLTVEGFVRELAGARRVLGNHVILEHDGGTSSVYAHLRHGSSEVRSGQRVRTGQRLAAIGNTGNTSEPHLHVHLMDDPRPTAAAGLPLCWVGVTMTPGDIDRAWSTKGPAGSAVPGMPVNGQIFSTSRTESDLSAP